ncbi:MAG TPA: PAS domain-containing protein, partial [Sphingomicrobium sp.]|nr:PAS domain-containing protein [Sphingomicrobium sp.]
MLQQELPRLDSRPVDGASRWLVPVILAAFALTGAGLLWFAGADTAALLFLAACAIAFPAALLLRPGRSRAQPPDLQQLVAAPDYSLVGAMLALTGDAAALTDEDGTLLAANGAYREGFDGRAPQKLPADEDSTQALATAKSMAWRDGGGCAAGIATVAGAFAVEVERVGARSDLLLWRFLKPSVSDPIAVAVNRLRGKAGELLSGVGVLGAFVDGEGRILSCNALFAARALSGRAGEETLRLTDLVEPAEEGQFRLVAEGELGRPLRAVHLQLDAPGFEDHGNFYLFDSPDTLPLSSSQHLQAMLDILPIGLALVDRDGRFLTMNDSFRQAAGLKAAKPVYPG